MKSLIEKIKKATESFAPVYMKGAEEFARAEYERFQNFDFNLNKELYGYLIDQRAGYGHTFASLRREREARKIQRTPYPEFLSKIMADAERRLDQATEKAAATLVGRGLNVERAVITVHGIDGPANLDLTVTDGEKTFALFTIIAAGPIVRPHYRYLVKPR